MDLITLDTITKLGFSVVISFIFIRYFINQSKKRDDVIIEELKNIKYNIGKTILDESQTISLFKMTLDHHIRKKLDFLKQKLINNHIKERRNQIEQQIRSEFNKITLDEAQFLSTFNTPFGDLGELLLSFKNDKLKWENFIDAIFVNFFNEGSIEQKLDDCKSIMEEIVNTLISKIK